MASYQGPHNPYINLLIIDSLSYPLFTKLLVTYHDIINIFNHSSIVLGATTITVNHNNHKTSIIIIKAHCICKTSLLLLLCNIICMQKHLHIHHVISINIPTSAYAFDLSNLLHFQHSYAKINVHRIHKI